MQKPLFVDLLKVNTLSALSLKIANTYQAQWKYIISACRYNQIYDDYINIVGR